MCGAYTTDAQGNMRDSIRSTEGGKINQCISGFTVHAFVHVGSVRNL